MVTRRTILKTTGAMALAAAVPVEAQMQDAAAVLRRPIPSSGDWLPAIGMGSWLTFQVGNDEAALAVRTEIVRRFLDGGGTLLDSSPMYGRAEAVLGHCLAELGPRAAAFRATKVWMMGRMFGMNQMQHSERLWGNPGFDLMQVHNLLDWETHAATLRDWQSSGRIRYTGITTSHGRRHEEMEQLIAREPFDFVQFTYNVIDREAEQRLLPLAADHGRAVIINRPFRGGELFGMVHGRPLPGFAAELGCDNWAQLFLKFVVSHPAVTVAIPATAQPEHMSENIAALRGPLPDKALRRRIVEHVEALA
jgi:aryl-alcohol dehydrogenase-like predicted oxidoreductase